MNYCYRITSKSKFAGDFFSKCSNQQKHLEFLLQHSNKIPLLENIPYAKLNADPRGIRDQILNQAFLVHI